MIIGFNIAKTVAVASSHEKKSFILILPTVLNWENNVDFVIHQLLLDFIRLLLLLCGNISLHFTPCRYGRKCITNRFLSTVMCPKARHVKYVREWGQKSQMAFYIFTYLTCRYYRPNEVASILLIMVTAKGKMALIPSYSLRKVRHLIGIVAEFLAWKGFVSCIYTVAVKPYKCFIF